MHTSKQANRWHYSKKNLSDKNYKLELQPHRICSGSDRGEPGY